MTETEWQAATTEEEYFVVHPAHVTAGEQALITADRYALGCAGPTQGKGATTSPFVCRPRGGSCRSLAGEPPGVCSSSRLPARRAPALHLVINRRRADALIYSLLTSDLA